MNLIWLEDFLALAQTGNFSRAAEARHSSQPAFSRRIRALEDWLGVALFDRASHPVRLTETGRWLMDVAQDLLARTARLPGDAQQIARNDADTLRIAATHALSFTFLPAWLQRIDHAGGAPVQLMSDVLARCEALMLQSKVQFLLCHVHPQAHNALNDERFASLSIGSDRLVPMSQARPDGSPRHGLVRETGEQAAVSLLNYTPQSGLGRIVQSVLGRTLSTLPHRVVFTAHLASVLRSMVLDGRGCAWLPESLVREDLHAGTMVRAGDGAFDVTVDIRLYRDRCALGQAAEALWAGAARRPTL